MRWCCLAAICLLLLWMVADLVLGGYYIWRGHGPVVWLASLVASAGILVVLVLAMRWFERRRERP